MNVVGHIVLAAGIYVCVANLYYFVSSIRGRHRSLVPILGAVLVLVGLLLRPETRSWAWVAPFVDLGTVFLILSLPSHLRRADAVARRRLLRRFTGERRATSYDLRLYDSGIFVLEVRADPPQECRAHSYRHAGRGFTGSWSEDEGDLRLDGYADERSLIIRKHDGAYVTEESAFVPVKGCSWESLDSLKLTLRD